MVLVALLGADAADFFVVPRDHVCGSVAAVMHALPKNARGSLGPQEFENYKDRWDLMERPAQDAEWLVPPWVTDTLKGMKWAHRPR